MQRNIYGMHAPVRLLMERKIVSSVSCFSLSCSSQPKLKRQFFQNPHMPAFPQSNLQLDILMGRDETIEPADIFGGAYPVFHHYYYFLTPLRF